MRKIKAGKKGEASQYKTRSNAIRDMQISLQDFRRLCILKGVYPREPKKKFKGNDKTYFHVKDLKILQHDTLLERFRSIKAHLAKHKKLLGRREVKLAEQHMKKVPKYSLAPVIKDRYPSFVDALRDLDDALCLISLFAQLPQHLTLEVKKSDLELCAELYRDFMLYCTVAQCFTKSFLSIKGVYYRVQIMGTPITWVQPYKFNQRLPFDVDYKIMGTFLEFYQGLVRFVNYKLFSDAGIQYPLKDLNPVSPTTNYLDASKVRQMQSHIGKLFASAREEAETEFQDSPEMQKLTHKTDQQKKQRKLFANCHFKLGRETPIYILQHLILSFGGSYVLQDDEHADKGVTHVCMDRPVTQTDKGIEYVSPQYIVDSVNNLYLLPTKPYTPGQPAPPHLSPFVDNESEGYIPDRQREINTLAGVATAVIEEAESSSEESDNQAKKNESEDDEIKGDADSSSGEESDESEEVKKPELTATQKAKKEAKLKADLKREQEDMGKMLMTQRQRKLYQKAEETRKAKLEVAQKLKEKKKVLSKRK